MHMLFSLPARSLFVIQKPNKLGTDANIFNEIVEEKKEET